MGKLKRFLGNLDITPLSEGLMSEAEFNEVFDPYQLKKKGSHETKEKATKRPGQKSPRRNPRPQQS